MTAFGFDTSDFIPCETCGTKAVDIHHIRCRGAGAKKGVRDYPANLMALCRPCHIEYGDKSQHIDYLYAKHKPIQSKLTERQKYTLDLKELK
jgi:hypothetical protein